MTWLTGESSQVDGNRWIVKWIFIGFSGFADFFEHVDGGTKDESGSKGLSHFTFRRLS